MKLLMHICCGPCAIYPLKELRTKGFEVTGLFYNPNIHPYREYKKEAKHLKITPKNHILMLFGRIIQWKNLSDRPLLRKKTDVSIA